LKLLILSTVLLVGCDLENRTVTVYPAHCEGELVQRVGANPYCRGKVTSPLSRFQFTVDHQTVVETWPDPTFPPVPPTKLQNCAVKDAENWHCATGAAGTQFHELMSDGDYSSWWDGRRPYPSGADTGTVYVSAVYWYALTYAPSIVETK
jgi:hypothetical protein